ncbi:MAG: HTH domain-containing protein [Chloroflexi bacterium]|nr:HTH domain-containing protein [Chloroflexota bacterium]MCY3685133.1 HTH domain-containing protein [Chloroflexota bacterium]MDE2707787.1 HTH domain-containing protein [Chloroflexota bacterium]
MHIPPRRRRRAVRIHYLIQRGLSQQQVAEELEISRTTVRSDLQLIETHWSRIAAPAADDLLLQSLQLLRIRLSRAIKRDPVAHNARRLTPVEYLHAHNAQETQLNGLAREIRRTVQQVQLRAEQRPDQPGLFDEQPQDSSETMTKLTKIAPPNFTISSPEQEIVPNQAPEKKIPTEPTQDALIAEAVQHFPHLKGQSAEQILHFLDQITNPNGQQPPIPTKSAA